MDSEETDEERIEAMEMWCCRYPSGKNDVADLENNMETSSRMAGKLRDRMSAIR